MTRSIIEKKLKSLKHIFLLPKNFFQARTKERDNYHNKLIEAEKKFDILEIEYNGILNGKEDESSLRQELKNLKIQMAQTQLKLDDRVRIVANQENQINALMSQVSSLKDVVNITKDLLNIRNMEVKHLQVKFFYFLQFSNKKNIE